MNIVPSRRPVKAEDVNTTLEIEGHAGEPVTLRALADLDCPYERLHLQALEQFREHARCWVTDAPLRVAGMQFCGDAALRSFAAERLWEHAADPRFAASDSVAVLKDLLTDSDPSVSSLAAGPWIMEGITRPNKRAGCRLHTLLAERSTF